MSTSTVKETDIGKVAITPKENNLSSYDILDLIVKNGRAYLSKKIDNKDAVTVSGSWLQMTENPYDVAKRLGYTGTEAEWLASLSVASEKAAELAIRQTEQSKEEIRKVIEENKTVIDQAKEVMNQGEKQINSMRALEENITNYVQSAPTRMELSYTQTITLGNGVEQRIRADLFPAYVLQNVLYLPASGTEVLTVDPDGLIHVHKAGTAKVNVIPLGNPMLYKCIEITITAPALRLTGSGSIRLNSNGTFRLT